MLPRPIKLYTDIFRNDFILMWPTVWEERLNGSIIHFSSTEHRVVERNRGRAGACRRVGKAGLRRGA